MKSNLTFLIGVLAVIFTAKTSFSQEGNLQRTIHVMSKGLPGEVYINDRLIISLGKDEALEYKLDNNGKLSVLVKNKIKTKGGLNVISGSGDVYIVSMGPTFVKIDKGKWEKEKKNFTKVVQLGKEVSTQDEKPEVTSTIHVMSKGWTSKIYFNDIFISGLNKDEALEYKTKAHGRVSITMTSSFGHRLSASFEIGNADAYVVNQIFMAPDLYIVDASRWQKERKNFTNVISKEEDSDNPIIKSEKSNKSKGVQGTCFLISLSGYLITNNHCIEGAKEIMIRGINGDFVTKYGAKLLAADPSNDLALLKLENKNLNFDNPPISIRSSGVEQAEKVYALGYPRVDAMGEEVKITDGIISAKSGAGGNISKFQISAVVNPGNSGGPLIDENGNLIGVIYAKSSVAESASYAVKASYLEAFLKNVDGFEFPDLVNTIMNKPLTGKVAEWKKYIYIVETN